jgi:hypothetical protein
MDFIVYDSTGKILRTGYCQDGCETSQAQSGETAMVGTANASTQMVQNGAVIDIPETILAQNNAPVLWKAYQLTARVALTNSDKTILRCMENNVAVPAEWATYRKALRSIISATTGDPTQALPTMPEYPSGT